MARFNIFQRLSQAPTNPHPPAAPRTFDVAELYRGPVTEKSDGGAQAGVALDEKLRQAYFWIVNTAIISPHYDIEYNDGPPQAFILGDTRTPNPAFGPELFQFCAVAAADVRGAPQMLVCWRTWAWQDR
jgi:hypothetical protein